MKKWIIFILLNQFVFLSHSQEILETSDEFTTDYISIQNPYYLGSADGVLFVYCGRDPYMLVRFPEADSREKYTIPSTVSRIAQNAFYGCKNLKELVIPPTIIYIGDKAFNNSGITSFIVGSSYNSSPSISFNGKGEQIWYDISGKLLSSPSHGINILIESGETKKVMID